MARNTVNRSRAAVTVALPLIALALLVGMLWSLSLTSHPAAAAPAADIWMNVNFTEDWLRGSYEVGHTFTLTVTDTGDSVKAVAIMQTTATGTGPPFNQAGFLTEPGDWSPSQPDIQPGDVVTFASDDAYKRVVHVGDITAALDPAADTVTGQITAPWLAGQTIQGDAGSWGLTFVPYTTTLNASGVGTYFVDFAPFDWPPSSGVTVSYKDGADAYIFMDVPPPAGLSEFLVNYTKDWVHGQPEPGHSVAITVTESDGSTVKATIDLVSDSSGFHTNTGSWNPSSPDIVPGDWVWVGMDTGYVLSGRVGAINANFDLKQNQIIGAVDAPWIINPITMSCAPLFDGGVSVESGPFNPAEDGSFACVWDPDTEWDMAGGVEVELRYCELGLCVRADMTVPVVYLPFTRH